MKKKKKMGISFFKRWSFTFRNKSCWLIWYYCRFINGVIHLQMIYRFFSYILPRCESGNWIFLFKKNWEKEGVKKKKKRKRKFFDLCARQIPFNFHFYAKNESLFSLGMMYGKKNESKYTSYTRLHPFNKKLIFFTCILFYYHYYYYILPENDKDCIPTIEFRSR